MKRIIFFMLFWMGIIPVASADYLDDVRSRGYLVCGVTGGLKGLSYVNETGEYVGFYAEICRGIASAVLGSKDAVEFIPVPERDRALMSLEKREVDVVSSPIAFTIAQDIVYDVVATTPVYYDTKRLMVHDYDRNKTAATLVKEKKTFCYIKGISANLELSRYLDMDLKKLNITEYNTYSQLAKAFTKGNCDALYEEYSVLKAIESFAMLENVKISNEILSYSVIAPLISNNGKRWENIIKWSINAIIAAEDKEVDFQNVSYLGENEVAKRFNLNKDVVKKMGFSLNFIYNTIVSIGNYGDVYNRTIMRELGIPRGSNIIGKKGGSLYSPSF